MRANETAAKPINKREQILDEALLLAGNFGYRGFSLKDLADRCDLTKQGVMHYFPTKDRLLVTLLDERDAAVEADLLSLLQGGGFDAADDLENRRAVFRQSLVDVIEHMLRTPELIRLHVILRAEAISEDHPARDYFIGRDDGTRKWLTRHMEGLYPDPAPLARITLATMLGLQQQWLQERQGFDLLEQWRQATDLLLR